MTALCCLAPQQKDPREQMLGEEHSQKTTNTLNLAAWYNVERGKLVKEVNVTLSFLLSSVCPFVFLLPDFQTEDL